MSAVESADDDVLEAPRPRRRRPAAARGPAPQRRKGAPVRRRQKVDEIEEDVPNFFQRWKMAARTSASRSARTFALVASFFALVAAAGLIDGGYLPGAFGRMKASVLAFISDQGLRIDKVHVVGVVQAPRDLIDATIGFKRGDSILFADPAEIRAKLEALSWVARAEVRRVWPNRIEVLIVERRPHALWQMDGVIKVVDRSGQPIAAHDPSRFRHLMLVVGKGAAERADGLFNLLAREPSVKARVKAAILVAERRWNLLLDNGVEVRLPEVNAEVALHDLADLDWKNNIEAHGIVAIDLRFPDRMIVKVPPQPDTAPQTPAVEGRDT